MQRGIGDEAVGAGLFAGDGAVAVEVAEDVGAGADLLRVAVEHAEHGGVQDDARATPNQGALETLEDLHVDVGAAQEDRGRKTQASRP